MVDFCVFNELSLPLKKEAAKNNFYVFFALLKELKNKNLNKIRISNDFKDYYIIKGIPLCQFIGQEKDKVLKDRIRSFLVNSTLKIDTPIIKQTDKKQIDIKNSTEYFFEDETTDGGLASCDIWNTIAISFNSSDKWDKYKINLRKETISKNEDIIECIDINHLSSEEHLKNHKTFFDDLGKEIRLNITIPNFWENREKNFPNKIRFCKEIEDSIKNLDTQVFKQAINILRDVEIGNKKITDFEYSGESKDVKNNKKLRKMRLFYIGDEEYFFNNHIKSLPNANRMYFLEKDDKIYISYIGKHLSTKKYK